MISVPTSGMAVAFIVGLALAIIWGMQVAVSGANAFSEFFGALGVIFPLSSAVTWVVLIIMAMAVFYLGRIIFPFFLGIIVGLLILTFLGSSIFSGITGESSIISSFIVTRDMGNIGHDFVTASRCPFPPIKKWSVVS